MSDHKLKADGAPFDSDGTRLNDGGTKGTGRALCTCGWTGYEADTRAARKADHKRHAEDPGEVTPQIGYEPLRVVGSDEHTDDIDLDIEESSEDTEAPRRGRGRPRVRDFSEPTREILLGGSEPAVVVQYDGPGSYWKTLATDSLETILSASPYELDVKVFSGGRKLYFFGDKKEALIFAGQLKEGWSYCLEELKSFKKSPAYLAIPRATKEGRAERYDLEKDFLRGTFEAWAEGRV